MRLCTPWILPAVAVTLLPSLGLARLSVVPAGMQGILMVNQKSVQEDLKLTADQVAKAADVFKELRGAYQTFADLSEDEVSKKVQQLVKEANKKLAAILTKDQAKRLKQIVLQIQGPFVDPAAAKELKITNEQKEKFKKLQSKAKKEMLKIFESAKGNFKDIMTKQREMAKKMNETVLKLLTDEQKAKWKAMTGKPFKGEIQPMTYTCKSISSQDASPLFSCQKQMAVAVRLQSLLRPRGRLRQTEDDAGEMK